MDKDSMALCMITTFQGPHVTCDSGKDLWVKSGGLQLSVSAIRNENAEWP